MSNTYFQFRQFTVHQDRCAMKVGTDGTLLGAWARLPIDGGRCRVLDIGTGTGLVALMIAQRYPQAEVLGVDVDGAAVCQARENVAASPFASRITVTQADAVELDDADGGFDTIVSNPPYFVDSLTCPDEQRTQARHAVSLTHEHLVATAFRLLKPAGLFSVVIPVESQSSIEAAAYMEGFFPSRVCKVRTTPRKPAKRLLMEFSKHPVKEVFTDEGVIEILPNVRSPWYDSLTRDFYIK